MGQAGAKVLKLRPAVYVDVDVEKLLRNAIKASEACAFSTGLMDDVDVDVDVDVNVHVENLIDIGVDVEEDINGGS